MSNPKRLERLALEGCFIHYYETYWLDEVGTRLEDFYDFYYWWTNDYFCKATLFVKDPEPYLRGCWIAFEMNRDKNKLLPSLWIVFTTKQNILSATSEEVIYDSTDIYKCMIEYFIRCKSFRYQNDDYDMLCLLDV